MSTKKAAAAPRNRTKKTKTLVITGEQFMAGIERLTKGFATLERLEQIVLASQREDAPNPDACEAVGSRIREVQPQSTAYVPETTYEQRADAIRSQQLTVGSLVVFWDHAYGYHRIWQVLSVCLGGLDTESLIELKALFEKPGHDTNGSAHATTWVPEPVIRNMAVYSAQ